MNMHELCFVSPLPISPTASHFWHCPKVTKRLAPAARLILECSRFYVNECGTRQRHKKASLTLRTVCPDDASTTAQHSALRGLQKGLFQKDSNAVIFCCDSPKLPLPRVTVVSLRTVKAKKRLDNPQYLDRLRGDVFDVL